MASTTKKITFVGGCHCGHIRYSCTPTVDPTTDLLGATRCNCTFCQKLGFFTLVRLEPSDFSLLSHASKAGIPDYQHGRPDLHRYFCDKCGVHIWREGNYEYEGQKYDFFMVNLSTADQPQPDGALDLKDVKIKYCDGLHDNFAAGVKDVPWSGGLV